MTSISPAALSPITSPKNPGGDKSSASDGGGNAFELALNIAKGGDGAAPETLTYQTYNVQSNGGFFSTHWGTGDDLASAYQSLVSTLQDCGETIDAAPSQLTAAFAQLQTRSQQGSADATVFGGDALAHAKFATASFHPDRFLD